MRFKPFLFVLACLVAGAQLTLAQTKFSKIKIDKNFKDTLSFVYGWDYPAGIYEIGNTREFARFVDGPDTIVRTAAVQLDTTHLFFTANCETNVQGGYKIRYCSAEKKLNKIVLTLADGLPDYPSEYYIHISGDSFYFRPKIIYPIMYVGGKLTYHITKQSLTLVKKSYVLGDTVIGYVNVAFMETISMPGEPQETHKLYLRGLIKTPLKQGIQNGR